MALIEVRGLTKSYGDRRVLRGIDLDVAAGEIVGVLGPNGAGKTTTVECIGGLRARDGGSVSVDGIDPTAGSREARGLREVLGMQLQQCRLPAKITPAEALALFGSFYADPVPADQLLARFGLAGQARVLFEKLSGGQQQRLSVALALVGRPRIAILDELTTGLDPAARREIWAYLRDLRAGGVTMLLVTHSMEEAAYLCDRVVIIDDGRIVAQGSPDELTTGSQAQETSFAADLPDDVLQRLRVLPGVRAVTRDDGRIVIDGDGDSPQAILTALLEAGVRPAQLRVTQPTLDEAYLRLTEES